MNSKQPVGATHLMTGSQIRNPWRDLSGPTWRWLSDGGEWIDTNEPSSAFFERNSYRLQALAVERDSSVADAALWLHMNRSAGRETWLRKTSGDTLVRIARGAQENDARQANDPLAIIRRLSEGDSGSYYSEAECFVADRLLQEGAAVIDDDANVYAVTLAQVVALLKAYQAPSFSEAGPMTLSVTVEMGDDLKAAFAQLEAYGPGELVVATPGVGALVPQPSTTLLRECVELLSMYDAGGGSREGLAVEELRTLIAARPAPQPPTSR